MGAFVLGVAFFLWECRSVTTGALLFGSTWIVGGLVLAAVFAALLAAATIMAIRQIPILPVGAGLLISLTTVLQLDTGLLLAMPYGTRIAAFALFFGLPIFFSSLLFSVLLANSKRPQLTLGLNVLGAFLGGCLEYLSLWLGHRALGWAALATYALAFALLWRFSRQ